jgi:hypothetical protein
VLHRTVAHGFRPLTWPSGTTLRPARASRRGRVRARRGHRACGARWRDRRGLTGGLGVAAAVAQARWDDGEHVGQVEVERGSSVRRGDGEAA